MFFAICFTASGNYSFHFMDLVLILINFHSLFCKHHLLHVNYISLSGNFKHFIGFGHLGNLCDLVNILIYNLHIIYVWLIYSHIHVRSQVRQNLCGHG